MSLSLHRVLCKVKCLCILGVLDRVTVYIGGGMLELCFPWLFDSMMVLLNALYMFKGFVADYDILFMINKCFDILRNFMWCCGSVRLTVLPSCGCLCVCTLPAGDQKLSIPHYWNIKQAMYFSLHPFIHLILGLPLPCLSHRFTLIHFLPVSLSSSILLIFWVFCSHSPSKSVPCMTDVAVCVAFFRSYWSFFYFPVIF